MSTNSHFDQRCYELLQQIPQGKVTTYKEMACALGSKAWRAVGTAMAKNTHLIHIPCHRVVKSDGSIGQYALGAEKKAELLRSEGIAIANQKIQNLDEYLFRFPRSPNTPC